MKTCFVIMPFGKKQLVKGKKIDFDLVYKNLIKKAADGLKLEVIRSDEAEMAGWIHRKMISEIFRADVCIADLTTLNPNVFYELGVRHALRRGVTVLIKHAIFDLPFNVMGMNTIDYTLDDFDSVRRRIATFIRKGLETSSAETDSLVFEVLPELQVTTGRETPISPARRTRYRVKKYPQRYIGLVGCDISEVNDIPVWVNSENTDMQMARSYDRSISSVIRYLGAKKQFGHITEDLIADDLATKLHSYKNVMGGTVLETTPGELATRGVKRLLHVAAVQGNAPGRGYRPVENLDECVKNILATVDQPPSTAPISVLLPLLGTGTAAGLPEKLVPVLLDATLNYLDSRPSSIIETVWFLVYGEQTWRICTRLLGERSARCGPGEIC